MYCFKRHHCFLPTKTADMKKVILLTAALYSFTAQAQVAIGPGNTTPHNSAMLEISSTNRGLLLPRLTTAQRTAIAAPAKGLLVYDSSLSAFYSYQNSWKAVAFTEDQSFVKQKSNSLPQYNFFYAVNPTDSSGFFEDGSTFDYSNNLNYTFTIIRPVNALVCRIEIISFETEAPHDSLQITNGVDFTQTLSGTQISKVYYISSGNITFRFKTNGSVTGDGFRLRWDFLFPPDSSELGKLAATAPNGSYYIPEKGAFVGGLQENNYWAKENLGWYSLNWGQGSLTSGIHSIGLGYRNTSTNTASIAMGRENKAQGEASVAMGKRTLALHEAAMAVGEETESTGSGALAAGYQSKAKGTASVAMNYQTTANAPYSAAFGQSTRTAGNVSSAFGLGNVAKGFASTVVGLYNDSLLTVDQAAVTSTTPLFVVGNGNGNNTRSNALVVYKNGDTELDNLKTLKVGGGTTISKQQAGEVIAGTNPGGSGFKTFTLTFPTAFSATPKIIATAKNDPSFSNVDDTFVVSVRSLSTTQVVFNIQRVDLNTGWSQNLRIEWMAWE